MNLLRVVLLFLIISINLFCDGLDPSPDVIEQCVNDDSCDANNASFLKFYHYVVEDEDDKENKSNTTNGSKGVQYTICATNSTGYMAHGNTITDVYADSICKINEVTMILPEDSNEKCSDLLSTTDRINGEQPFSSKSDCLDRCNNVIFKDWNENEANDNELDDDVFGYISMATTSIDGEEVCLCAWGNNTRIVGCVSTTTTANADTDTDTDTDTTASDVVGTTANASNANANFIITGFTAAVFLAVIVVSATAIEMMVFV